MASLHFQRQEVADREAKISNSDSPTFWPIEIQNGVCMCVVCLYVCDVYVVLYMCV